jgi:aminomethyltransferase
MHSSLSALLHPTGGIVDDCIITNLGERDGKQVYYFVTNAGNRDKDIAYLTAQLEDFKSKTGGKTDLEWKMLPNNGLIAIQGPKAVEIVKNVGVSKPDGEPFDLNKLHFGQCAHIRFGNMGTTCLVSRGGYTGEDGFEISVPSGGRLGENKTLKLTELLLTASEGNLRLAGLGARDTLRLEAGMCLYGHDIDDSTSPVEAGLSWIIPKSRRENGGFLGSDTILAQLKTPKNGGTGVKRRRVGFVINDKAPAREGSKIVNAESGEEIGVVTSGSPSPSLGKNIAMGYIKNGLHKSGTEVGLVVRGKTRKAVVSKMPFVASKYFKGE